MPPDRAPKVQGPKPTTWVKVFATIAGIVSGFSFASDCCADLLCGVVDGGRFIVWGNLAFGFVFLRFRGRLLGTFAVPYFIAVSHASSISTTSFISHRRLVMPAAIARLILSMWCMRTKL